MMGTRQDMKKLFHLESFVIIATITITLVAIVSVISACGHAGLKVKVYVSKPQYGGIVRLQDDEVVPYGMTNNFRCVSKEDFDSILLTLKQCQIGD